MFEAQAGVERQRKQPFVVCRKVTRRQASLVSTFTVMALVASSLLAWDGEVPAWEESALVFFNEWPDWLEPLMWFLQQVGVAGAPVIAAAVVYYFTRRWQHFIAFAAVLPLKLLIEKGVVKQLVARERPFVSVGENINVRGPAFEGLSFPSGHTTTAVAVGVLLSAFLPPRWRPVPLAWAAAVGIARLYYGEHNLLDVVAGAATGTLFAVVLWYFLLNRTVDDDQPATASS